MFQASTYGAVKAPKIVADAQQGTNRSSETLENKMVRRKNIMTHLWCFRPKLRYPVSPRTNFCAFN